MRTFKDKNGFAVKLNSITGRNDFEGVLEGSAYGARQVRYMQAERDMHEKNGILYWNFEAIKRDAENASKENLRWPAKERWEANLTVKNYLGCFEGLYKTEIKHLKVVWFLDGGDPTAELEEIIRNIDFNSLCHSYVEEDYD